MTLALGIGATTSVFSVGERWKRSSVGKVVRFLQYTDTKQWAQAAAR